MNDENMLGPGRDIARRLAFELSILKNPTWKDVAYARLGAVRSRMTPENVEIIQKFLRD